MVKFPVMKEWIGFVLFIEFDWTITDLGQLMGEKNAQAYAFRLGNISVLFPDRSIPINDSAAQNHTHDFFLLKEAGKNRYRKESSRFPGYVEFLQCSNAIFSLSQWKRIYTAGKSLIRIYDIY